MSVGSLVRVFTSIVDTVPLRVLATKTVLPSGVTASPVGPFPTVMSVGCLVLVFTSIVDTVSLPLLATNAVARHRRRVASVDAPVGTAPTSAPPTHTPTPTPPLGTRRIPAPASLSLPASVGATRTGYVALALRTRRLPSFPLSTKRQCRTTASVENVLPGRSGLCQP